MTFTTIPAFTWTLRVQSWVLTFVHQVLCPLSPTSLVSLISVVLVDAPGLTPPRWMLCCRAAGSALLSCYFRQCFPKLPKLALNLF